MWLVWWGYVAFWTTMLYVLTKPLNHRVHNLHALPEADNVVDAVGLFLKEQRRRGP